jgi:hypothetical protein
MTLRRVVAMLAIGTAMILSSCGGGGGGSNGGGAAPPGNWDSMIWDSGTWG